MDLEDVSVPCTYFKGRHMKNERPHNQIGVSTLDCSMQYFWELAWGQLGRFLFLSLPVDMTLGGSLILSCGVSCPGIIPPFCKTEKKEKKKQTQEREFTNPSSSSSSSRGKKSTRIISVKLCTYLWGAANGLNKLRRSKIMGLENLRVISCVRVLPSTMYTS